MRWSRDKIGALILAVFYTIGVIGLSWERTSQLFLVLTPFNLLLSFAVLIWVNRDNTVKFMTAFLLVFLTGYLVELAGIHTGVLFGSYTYGDPLGLQILGVPVIIGINWYILAYASRGVAKLIYRKHWIKSVVAAVLMVALDLVIEPVAVKLGFWTWDGGEIPLRNYLMWFITSLFMQWIMTRWETRLHRNFGLALLIIQFLFFGILNLTLS